MSLRLPPNFDVNVRIIKTIRSLPVTGRLNVGYTAAVIAAQYNALFPAFPLTLVQVYALLVQGAKRGVYSLGGCASGAAGPTSCSTTPTVTRTNDSLDNQLFFVNTSMASYNYTNIAYVAVGYAADPNTPRLGYLPCGACSSGGGYGYNPYSSSGSGLLNSAAQNSAGITGGVGGSNTGNGATSVMGGITTTAVACPAGTCLA
jgi:hypothetical protein